MNIALFLTPKSEVITLERNYTIQHAMDVMAKYRYTSVPVIDQHGKFDSALSEGDLLWHISGVRNIETMEETAGTRIRKVKRHHDLRPVSISEDMESLIALVATQSFVPVVDDDEIFIGIIKRSDIINYTVSQMNKRERVCVS